MQKNRDVTGQAGLRFFGRITASTTHELNNCLGILNENAGLLEDLALMADRGMAVDPARWSSISGRISSQVRRAGEIVRRLNSFAHSVDSDRAETDMGTILELTVALCERLLAEDQVRVTLDSVQEDILLSTTPFQIIHLVGHCLALAARHALAPARELRLACAPVGKGRVVVSLRGLDPASVPSFSDLIGQELLATLDADIRPGGRSGEVLLELGQGRELR